MASTMWALGMIRRSTLSSRHEHRIHFRLADPPKSSRQYADELLDAYLFIEDADALYAEYVARGVEFTRVLATRLGTRANLS